jgi:hypothetical protein
MPTSQTWLSKAISAIRGTKKRDQLIVPRFEPAKTPAPDTLLKCDRHPTPEVPPSKLCDGCQKFVEKCHWIQCYKLPSLQFSKLSTRKLRHGSHTWDGGPSFFALYFSRLKEAEEAKEARRFRKLASSRPRNLHK